MPSIRKNIIATLRGTNEQRADLHRRAQEAKLSVENYLRSLLGWPMEQQGRRKDLDQQKDEATEDGKQ